MKKLCVLCSALGILLLSAAPASAHATLVHADPPPNARLAAAPASVTLWYDEELNKRFSAVFVLDTNQSAVDRQDVTFSDDLEQMRVGVKAGLPDGVYTVSYRVLSAVDGHFYPGSYVFTVGNGAAPAARAASTYTIDWSRLPLDVLVRGLNLLAALALCGAFTLCLLMGDQDKEFGVLRRAAGPRLRRWLALLLALLFAGVIASQLLQAITASGKDLAEVLGQGLAFISLTDTRFGQAALARLLLVGSLALLYWTSRDSASPWRIQRLGNARGMDVAYFSMSALVLLSLSLSSHAAAGTDGVQLALVSDWLHLLAVGAWTGGLFALTVVLRPALAVVAAGSPGAGAALRERLSSIVLRRFSNLAVGSVILFTVTGVYAMWRQVSSPNALVDTAYGETLIFKHILIVPLILLGVVNTVLLRGGSLPGALAALSGRLRRLKIVPAQAGDNPFATVLHNVRFEAALGVLVIVAAAGMTSLPPARTAVPPTAPAAVAIRMGLDFSAALEIAPFATGNARFDLTLRDLQGNPLPAVSGVTLRFTSPDSAVAPLATEASAVGNGVYTAQGNYLTAVGVWRVDALIRGKDPSAAPVQVPFRLNVPDPANIPPAGFPDLNAGLLTALLVLGLGGLLVAQLLRSNGWLGKLIGGALAAGLLLFFASIVFAAPPPRPLAVNPYAPDAPSLARGQSIYEQNCLVCHGPTGEGSEALSADLRPTGFLTNMQSHGDDVLYQWLTNGIPGTAMVSWQTRLTDVQRWQVLNYVEFLAEQAAARRAAAATSSAAK